MRRVIAFAVAASLSLSLGIVVGRITKGDRAGGGGGLRRVAVTPPGNPGGSDEPAPSSGASDLPLAVDDARLARTDAVFSASARSLDAAAVVSGLRRVRLAGTVHASLRARVTSSSGKDLGTGTLVIGGSSVALSGRDLRLWAASLLVRPGEDVRVSASGALSDALPPWDSIGGVQVRLGSLAGVSASSMEFMADGSGESPAQPVPLSGTVKVRPAGGDLALDLASGPFRWSDAPSTLRLRVDGRGSLSWAGTGTVDTGAAKPRRMQYGGLAVSEMDATVRRGSRIQAKGRATVTQVYDDGRPTLRTRATVDLIDPVVRAERERRHDFTWAPRNLGGDFDLCITKIVPLSREATWASLKLEPMPAMAGGVSRPRRGGVTTGFADRGNWFGGAAAIASVIPPADADRRDISFDVPADAASGVHLIRIRLEGNFEPVTVEIEVRVA